ncbi:hypothetical protein [Anaeromyxobacter paludicola]|uniref:Uncharacterized protein n=1 Tax=Anaeromyxobacter paludicola TaxID=2918171 RepID=A0ABN6N350_9BACT|nr:hypothetical protein [Anaeromyxobacter paludicola]BDG07616.1 hypothetical protein AMPC_07290 [Anaeromyxobacter paludicola]
MTNPLLVLFGALPEEPVTVHLLNGERQVIEYACEFIEIVNDTGDAVFATFHAGEQLRVTLTREPPAP